MRSWLLGTMLLALSCKLQPERAPPAEPPPRQVEAPRPVAAGEPMPPAPETVAPELEREAGGRPVSWWRERLAQLRRDGQTELYELTVQRARANGLEVKLGEDGEVAVLSGPGERKP